jgi:ATP-dependent DNA ligase
VHSVAAAKARRTERSGNDFTARFPLAAAAVGALPANSFLIDGEAIVTNAKGLAVFATADQRQPVVILFRSVWGPDCS